MAEWMSIIHWTLYEDYNETKENDLWQIFLKI